MKILTIDEEFIGAQIELLKIVFESSIGHSREYSSELLSHFLISPQKKMIYDFRKSLKDFLLKINKNFKFELPEEVRFEHHCRLLEKEQSGSSCCRIF